MSVLWGARVGLKPMQDPITDAEIGKLYRWSRDENVLRWSGSTPTDLTFDEFRARLRNEHASSFDHRQTYLILTRAGELIGRIGCFAMESNEGELGVVIGEPSAWGKGLGREAIQLLVKQIFETTALERIFLYTFPENVRAQKCFAACGFRSLGVARRFSPDLGEFDGIEMEITRQEVNLPQNHTETHGNISKAF